MPLFSPLTQISAPSGAVSVTVAKSDDKYIVSGRTASGIGEGTYTTLRVCVRHEEGVGGLSNKVYNNFKVTYADPL